MSLQSDGNSKKDKYAGVTLLTVGAKYPFRIFAKEHSGRDREPLQREGGKAQVCARRARRGTRNSDIVVTGKEEGDVGVSQGKILLPP